MTIAIVIVVVVALVALAFLVWREARGQGHMP